MKTLRQELIRNAYRVNVMRERKNEPDWDRIFVNIMQEVKNHNLESK